MKKVKATIVSQNYEKLGVVQSRVQSSVHRAEQREEQKVSLLLRTALNVHGSKEPVKESAQFRNCYIFLITEPLQELPQPTVIRLILCSFLITDRAAR